MIGLKKYFEVPSSFYGEEMKKRHNSSLFRADTIELGIGPGHMTPLSFNLGTSFCKWGLLTAALKEQPIDEEMYRIFIESIDCIIKKVMYHRGLPKQRMFLKSHLLIAARELEPNFLQLYEIQWNVFIVL